jgi:alkylated DNA repair dioxygenase AlkB
MGWHADNEKEMKANGSIASLSFGAARTFQFKHRITGEKHQIELENGSLLEMKGETQRYWLHQLPKRLRISEPRINVTFRQLEQA